MDETHQQPPQALTEARQRQPGRRTRRKRSKRRRMLRALLPFLILGALGLLSTGIVKVVETQVPSSAEELDSRRLARSQREARDEIKALAASLEENWIPVVEGSEDDLFAEELMGHDALLELERSPRSRDGFVSVEREQLDQLTMPMSSTSKTSAAPPGILGGAPASP